LERQDALLQAQEDALNITLTDKQKTDLVNYANVSLGPIGIAGILGRKVGKGLVGAVEGFELPTFGDIRSKAVGK
jgi:hypothetical protein